MLFAIPITHTVKVSVFNRVAAKFVDLILVIICAGLVTYPVGPLLGFVYSLCADGLNFGPFHGQSLGKKLMKLQVVDLKSKKPITVRESAMRNAPIGVATFFAIIPFWGWLILILVGFPLMVMEIYLMMSAERGHRLGDVMGDTEVIEAQKS